MVMLELNLVWKKEWKISHLCAILHFLHHHSNLQMRASFSLDRKKMKHSYGDVGIKSSLEKRVENKSSLCYSSLSSSSLQPPNEGFIFFRSEENEALVW